jgi:hypothetical protein
MILLYDIIVPKESRTCFGMISPYWEILSSKHFLNGKGRIFNTALSYYLQKF